MKTVWIMLAFFSEPQVGISALGELMGVYADEQSCNAARPYIKVQGDAELKCVEVPLGTIRDRVPKAAE